MASKTQIQGISNIILIGVPDVRGLERVLVRLESCSLPYHAWREPDYDMGFTAIATEPLDDAQRAVLARYRLWNPLMASSSVKERSAVSRDSAERSVVQVHPGQPDHSRPCSSVGRAADSNSVAPGFEPQQGLHPISG